METIERIYKENNELFSLLKMKIRVDMNKSSQVSVLRDHIERLLALESQVISQLNYYKNLEEEVVSLRTTCEKFSDLSNSVSETHHQYKALIERKDHEKDSLSQEVSSLRKENEDLKTALESVQATLKQQQEQWDRDRALFAQEKHAKRIQDQKLLSTMDRLERLKKTKNKEEKDYSSLKTQIKSLQEKLKLVDNLEEELVNKDQEIERLKRKYKLIKKDFQLCKDEWELLK